MRMLGTAVAAMAIAGAGSAFAQGQVDVSGQWQCQLAGKAHNNDLAQTHNWNFALQLNRNGQFQFQGTYLSPSIGFVEQAHGYGSWQLQNSPQGLAMMTQGTWIRSYGGAVQTTWGLFVRDARTMLYNNADQYTQVHYMCQR